MKTCYNFTNANFYTGTYLGGRCFFSLQNCCQNPNGSFSFCSFSNNPALILQERTKLIWNIWVFSESKARSIAAGEGVIVILMLLRSLHGTLSWWGISASGIRSSSSLSWLQMTFGILTNCTTFLVFQWPRPMVRRLWKQISLKKSKSQFKKSLSFIFLN